jgi:hypothetical protein
MVAQQAHVHVINNNSTKYEHILSYVSDHYSLMEDNMRKQDTYENLPIMKIWSQGKRTY